MLLQGKVTLRKHLQKVSERMYLKGKQKISLLYFLLTGLLSFSLQMFSNSKGNYYVDSLNHLFLCSVNQPVTIPLFLFSHNSFLPSWKTMKLIEMVKKNFRLGRQENEPRRKWWKLILCNLNDWNKRKPWCSTKALWDFYLQKKISPRSIWHMRKKCFERKLKPMHKER